MKFNGPHPKVRPRIERLEERVIFSGSYRITEMSLVARDSTIVGLNEAGKAVIVSGGNSYQWSSKDGIQPISPEHDQVVAGGLNASGQITGAFVTNTGANHLFLFDKNGFHDLGT